MWDLAKHSQNIVAVTEAGDEVTYGELAEHCDRLNKHLEPRSLLLCLCDNDLASLVGYVSCLNHNVVPIMLKADIEPEVLAHFIKQYAPSYLYLPSERVGDVSGDVFYSDLDYALVKTPMDAAPILHDDLALLLTTSGSTGSPKLVRLSYKNIQSNTDAIIDYLELDSTERAITTLPMNYTFGLSVINSHLQAGASLALTNKGLMQKEFWEQLKTQHVTSLSGVPYTFDMLHKMRLMRMELPHLKTLTQAGGKLSLKLHEAFAAWAQEQGKRFIVMYGQTEATARMAYLPHDKAIKKAGSMGIAIPGGPKGDEWQGVLHTGDIANCDDDGFYTITGRKKRFLKIFGNRVNLDETERLIQNAFSLSDCACAGVDDKMYIFMTDDSYKADIKAFLVARTSLNPIAFKFVILDAIPHNDSGKVNYGELAQHYA